MILAVKEIYKAHWHGPYHVYSTVGYGMSKPIGHRVPLGSKVCIFSGTKDNFSPTKINLSGTKIICSPLKLFLVRLKLILVALKLILDPLKLV